MQHNELSELKSLETLIAFLVAHIPVNAELTLPNLLSDDALRRIWNNSILTPQDRVNFALTNQRLYQLFKDDVAQMGTHKLVMHVVRGELDAARDMILKNSEFLFKRTTVVDFAGRIIKNVTAYECAIGAGDVEMIAMITAFFDDQFLNLPPGEAENERLRQHNKQLPTDLKDEPLHDFSIIFAAIEASDEAEIESAITLTDRETRLSKALDDFRNAKIFKPHEVKIGRHFDLRNLMECYDVYSRSFMNPNWSPRKRELFRNQVTGYVMRFLPACDLQALTINFDKALDLLERGIKLERTFKCKHNNRVTYPLMDRAGLGYEYELSTGGGPGPARWPTEFWLNYKNRYLNKISVPHERHAAGLSHTKC